MNVDYREDLIDVTRQSLQALFGSQFNELRSLHVRGDAAAFACAVLLSELSQPTSSHFSDSSFDSPFLFRDYPY